MESVGSEDSSSTVALSHKSNFFFKVLGLEFKLLCYEILLHKSFKMTLPRKDMNKMETNSSAAFRWD